MKKILCLHENYNAVNTYRLHRFLDHIENKVTKQGYLNKKRRTIGDIAKSLEKKGDVWIGKYLPNAPEHNANFIATLLSAKKLTKSKLITDFDDDIWHIPVSNPTFWHFREHAGALAYLAQEADVVTCSTEPLAMELRKYSKNVKVIKNVINPKDWTGKKKKNKKIRIGWIFSITHTGDIKPVEQALTEIMEEYKDEVEFILMGGAKGLFPFEYKFTNGVKYTEYIKELERINLDISICPLANNVFNKSKSNIKWLESTMAGSAVVASKVYPYEHSIKNGKTGFVCGSKNQWKNALRKLIESEELRKKIVENAKKEVLAGYNIENEAVKYQEFIESI
jgi:O-antigen biosynthesis protein